MNEENKNVNLSNEEYIEKLENAIKDLNSYNDNLQQERDFYKNIAEELKKEITTYNGTTIDYRTDCSDYLLSGRSLFNILEELEKRE